MSDKSNKDDKSPKGSLRDICDDISSSSFADSGCVKSKSGNNSALTSALIDPSKSFKHESPIEDCTTSLKSDKTEESVDTKDSLKKVSIDQPNYETSEEEAISEADPKGDDWTKIDLELEQLAKDTSIDKNTAFGSDDDIEMELSTINTSSIILKAQTSEKTNSEVTTSDVLMNSKQDLVQSNTDLPSPRQEIIYTDNIYIDTELADNFSIDNIPKNKPEKDYSEEEYVKLSKDHAILETIPSDSKDTVTEYLPCDNKNVVSENVSKKTISSEDFPSEKNEKYTRLMKNESETLGKQSIKFDDIFEESKKNDVRPVSSVKQNILLPATLDNQNPKSDNFHNQPVTSHKPNIQSDDKQNIELDKLSKEPVTLDKLEKQTDDLCNEPLILSEASNQSEDCANKLENKSDTLSKPVIQSDHLSKESKETLRNNEVNSKKITKDLLSKDLSLTDKVSDSDRLCLSEVPQISADIPLNCKDTNTQNSSEGNINSEVDALDSNGLRSDNLPDVPPLSGSNFENSEKNTTSPVLPTVIMDKDSYDSLEGTAESEPNTLYNLGNDSDNQIIEASSKVPSISETLPLDNMAMDTNEILTENTLISKNEDLKKDKTSNSNDKLGTVDINMCDSSNLDENDSNSRDKSESLENVENLAKKDENSKDKFDLLTEHSEENSGDGQVPDNTDTLGLFSVTSMPLDRDEEEEFNDEIAEDSGEDNQMDKINASEAPDFSDIDHSLESFATSMLDHEEFSSANSNASGNAFGLVSISSVSGNAEETMESSKAFDSLLENTVAEQSNGENKDNLAETEIAEQTNENGDTEDKESSNGSELVMDLDNEICDDMDIEENLVSNTSIFTSEEQELELEPSKDTSEEPNVSLNASKDNNTAIEKLLDMKHIVDAKETEKAEKEETMEIVDLDSNSDDDVSKEPPTKKERLTESNLEPSTEETSTTTINLPSGIEVMSTSETAKTSTIISNKGESLIKGIPKPLTPKKAAGFRINTSEITITTIKTPQQDQSDQVVVLDSDEEEEGKNVADSLLKAALMKRVEAEEEHNVSGVAECQEISENIKKSRFHRCVNSDCTSTADTTEYYRCPLFVLSHYGLKRKGGTQKVCQHCLESVVRRMQEVMDCARQGNPLWEMHPQAKEDLVEISDSDEEDDDQEQDTEPQEKLSNNNVDLLEKCLEQTINDTWVKYKFDDQIRQSQMHLLDQLLKVEKDCEEVTALFNDAQKSTDAMRAELYGEFPVDRHELSPLDITDEAEHRLRAAIESAANEFSPVTSTQHLKGLTPRKLSDDDDWTPAALGEEFPEERMDVDTQGRRSSRNRKPVNYLDMDGVAEDASKLSLDSFHKNAIELQQQMKSTEVRPNIIALPAPKPHGETPVPPVQNLEAVVTPSAEPSLISDTENCASDNGDDVSDVSLVGDIEVERAPADLPPNGELIRKPLQYGDGVYARKSASFGGWAPATIMNVWPRGTKQTNGVASPFTLCRVMFEVAQKNLEQIKQLNARNLAYGLPANVRYPIGARVVALFAHIDSDKKGSYYSGIIAETPTPVNDYRYMVFFDDGYVQYVQHKDIRLVVEHSPRVYEDVLQESRDFVKAYLSTYPERPMVRLQRGQALKVQDSNKQWSSARVLRVDASLAQIRFEDDGHKEWIYRGSTRLAPLYLELKAAGKPQRRRGLGLSKTATMFNTPYVEYTRIDSMKDKSKGVGEEPETVVETRIKPRRGRAVAKKSLSALPATAAVSDASTPGDSRSEAEASRVVYYSPKIALKPQTMIPHECGEACRRTDVLTMYELRTYNPLARPLLTGFQRNHILVGGKRAIEYRAPCGRRIRKVSEMHHYLRLVGSDMSVDLFHFDPAVHCLAEFVLNWCRVSKKDLSHGMENVPIPCVNFYDSQLPPFCAYSTARIPTAGVHLNLDPDFLCGCDCTDDCVDKSKCACWQLTLSGARAIGKNSTNVGYNYKRLPEPLPTGIFECNSKCKCRVQTCLNRVVQHPLQLKLQVFKTDNRGWGIRALNDVPKGTFLCIYSGNLLTDSTANVDGLLEGDEYLAELDYIEVVERMKEGFEPDVPLRDRILDSKGLVNEDDEDEDESEEENRSERDTDFRPEYIDMNIATNDIGSRLRKRTKKVVQNKPTKPKGKDKKKVPLVPDIKLEVPSLSDKHLPDPDEEFTITISDDDEAREPSSFAATAGCDDEEYIPRNMSVRALFGKDEKCYIMDAKVRGNIGRYLNHSCAPNVFVQNVFVDTHDPRFPWVGFFAQSFIRAGVELTWNYNYDIGSVPDKIIYCKCGTENCRGRLL